MGRGNIRVQYECEGLYYLDKNFLHMYSKVEKCACGNVVGFDHSEPPRTARELNDADIEYDFDGKDTEWAFDRGESYLMWESMIGKVKAALMRRFKSFREADKWRDGERRVVLENEFFHVAVADNEWSAAWLLSERMDVDDTGPNRALMYRHCDAYLKAIKHALIDEWGEAIGYGGPWVYGAKYTKADAALNKPSR